MFTIEPEKITIPTSGALYDERSAWPADENLMANIRYHGQIQPIVVRKNGDKIEVVSGRQRLKAITEINRQAKVRGEKTMTVKCVLAHGTDAEHYSMMISENEIRRGDDSMTKAAKAKRLLQYGVTAKDIAIIYGVQVRAVEEWLSLTDVVPEVQQAIHKGDIAAGVGVELAKLPREEQAAKLEEMKAEAAKSGGQVTVHQARRQVRSDKRPDTPPKPKARSARELRSKLDSLCVKPVNEITEKDRLFAEFLEWALGLTDDDGNDQEGGSAAA
jgi:ParB family chromosome partitioning protein